LSADRSSNEEKPVASQSSSGPTNPPQNPQNDPKDPKDKDKPEKPKAEKPKAAVGDAEKYRGLKKDAVL
jgi:hypothetical protein